MIDAPDALNISSTYVVLDECGDTLPVSVSDQLYKDLAAQFGDFKGKRLVSHYTFSRDWDTWEMHPAGEELVCLLLGAVDFVLDRHGVEHSVPLKEPGSFVIVPRGIWHTVKVHMPSTVLFITPGEGTQHQSR
jgi:hypothetical protein